MLISLSQITNHCYLLKSNSNILNNMNINAIIQWSKKRIAHVYVHLVKKELVPHFSNKHKNHKFVYYILSTA